MNPILTLAVKAARRAGNIILRYMDRLDQIVVEQKGPNDFVSEVDRMVEEDIIDTIHYLYPNHSIVAEESGGQLCDDSEQQEMEWIIDPLDGTANYLHGHPHFAVSIAARQNGQVQHGVIFDPLRDEMYTASRGQGAQINNRRIRVTHKNTLVHSLLATGFPHKHHADYEQWMHTFQTLLPQAIGMRRCGSAALDLAYVACGRLDGYWEPGLGAWDIAAGSLLVREAGGLVADFQGGQDFLQSGQVIAANQMIFSELMRVVSTKPVDPNTDPEA